jgi:hypothetical protein
MGTAKLHEAARVCLTTWVLIGLSERTFPIKAKASVSRRLFKCFKNWKIELESFGFWDQSLEIVYWYHDSCMEKKKRKRLWEEDKSSGFQPKRIEGRA